MKTLRILVLCAYFPWHGHGGGVLVGNLLRQLSQRHEVTVLTYIEPGEERYLPEVAGFCQHLQTVPWQQGEGSGPSARPAAAGRLRGAWRRLPSGLRSSMSTLRQIPRQWQEYRRQPLPAEVSARQTPAFADAVARQWRDGRFDLVLAEWPEMALYGAQAPSTVVRVLDSIELRSVTYRRHLHTSADLSQKLFWLLQWSKMRRLESHIAQQYDVVTAVSQKEGQGLARLRGKADIVVNPIGLELACKPRQDVDARRRDTLVFLGRMSYGPNADAVRYFLQCYPAIRAAVPSVRFIVVGGAPPTDIQALDGMDGITVTGYVPDVDEYLATGTLFVMPMRQGGGIKVKALEAMASGIPIIATPAGAEGLDAVVDGRDILVAQTASDFVAKTVRLLRDSELRQRIADSARDVAWKQYNSATNVAQLEELYMAKVDQRRQA